MNVLLAILQGIIQGLTEFLPVSSSGHLSLFQHYTGMSGEAGLTLSIMLHLGTLIAVCIAFRKTIVALVLEFIRIVQDIAKGRFKISKINSMPPMRRMAIMLVVSLLPLFVFLPFKGFLESLSTDTSVVIEALCFLMTGTLLLLASSWKPGTKTAADMTYRDAVTIGFSQGFAMLPGLSRSGTTMSTGMLCGLTRDYAVDFSFIMSIPTILAAVVFQLPKLGRATGQGLGFFPTLLGMIVAAVVGFFAIRLLKKLVLTGKFKVFAYYTLILGVVVLTIEILGIH